MQHFLFLPPRSTSNTHEAVAPSQHDWKIVYRDVKNQINQPTFYSIISYLKNMASFFKFYPV